MAYQAIFKRVEKKFLITPTEKDEILHSLGNKLVPDAHFHSAIGNIYYDTPSFLIARNSMEKPLYKEKIRLRTYSVPEASSMAFLEIKKKYDGIVYKRRLSLPYEEARLYMEGKGVLSEEYADSQIGQEIEYFRSHYDPLGPAMVLSYNRESYLASDDSGVRITFDDRIQWRTDRLDLAQRYDGNPVLPRDTVLMEIKIPEAYPRYLVDLLCQMGIFQTSFSKYVRAYQDYYRQKNETGAP